MLTTDLCNRDNVALLTRDFSPTSNVACSPRFYPAEVFVFKLATIVLLITCLNLVVSRNLEAAPLAIPIKGKVTNKSGQPLSGVSIMVKGTNQGTVAAADGSFEINVVDTKAVLVFSIVGYKTREIEVASQTNISVELEAFERDLDNVVVIGYGAVKKRDLAGSVGIVSVEDLQKAPVVSFDQALAGRVAGAEVRSVDGQPGGAINIVIRGGNSVTQSNSPLYVIDDFPIENNDNNFINPNDIESIVVLKDAAATAIYGSRGANGVILITTKRGKAGLPVIKYDFSYGFQTRTKEIPLLSPYEFVRLQLEIDSVNATLNYLVNGKTLEDYRNAEPIDWYEKLFQRADMKTHNISLSGGTAKSRYSLAGSITDQEGVIYNSGFKRYQGRMTLDQQVSDKLKVGMLVNYSDYASYGTIVNNLTGALPNTSLLFAAWTYRPVNILGQAYSLEEEIVDPANNTTSGVVDRRVNPVIQAQNEVRESKNTNFFANGFLEYDVLGDLKLRITGGINKTVSRAISFNNSLTRLGSPYSPISIGVNGSDIYGENINYANENTLTYNKNINDVHSINVVGGFSWQKSTFSRSGAEAGLLPNEALGISGLDEGTPRLITAASSASRLLSVYTRASYNYKSKYYVQGILRSDGSSKFAKGSQWANFPSIGVKYALAEESFMKRFDFITSANIRGSFGYSGNNRVSDYAYLSNIAFLASNSYPFGNTTPLYGSAPNGIGNPDLKWETTRAIDVGVDLAFFDERILFTADYYKKVTKDLLLNAQVPGTTGFTQAFKNIGSVSNHGFEFTLSTVNFSRGDFKWNSSFNISFNRNKVLSLTNGQESLTSTSSGVFGGIPKYIAKIGHPVAMFMGVIFDGLYQYEDFYQLANGTYVLKDHIPTNGNSRASIQPGHNKYVDLNKDGVVNSEDYTIIGDPNADFIGGFNNNFEYKGFDLNVFFRFSYGNDVLNANRLQFEGTDNFIPNTNMYATYANRWTPTNTNTDIAFRAGRGPSYWNTRVIEDGSMLRLQVVALGYTFSGGLVKKLKMQSFRLNFAANNLYTWTGYSGLDPEVSVYNSNLTPAMDFSAYPRARTFTFGLNATF